MSNPIYLHTIYCDDARQEVGNKMSLIGIYGPDMYVETSDEEVEISLCVVSSLSVPAEKEIKNILYTLKLDDDVLHKIEQKIEEKPEQSSNNVIINSIGFVRFIIKKNTVLSVSATINGKDNVFGQSLRIQLNK